MAAVFEVLLKIRECVYHKPMPRHTYSQTKLILFSFPITNCCAVHTFSAPHSMTYLLYDPLSDVHHFCFVMSVSVANKLVKNMCLLLSGKRTLFIPASGLESRGDHDSTNKSSLFCMSVDNKGKSIRFMTKAHSFLWDTEF